jgi:hypothetical protein
VDCVVEVATRLDYHKLERELVSLGFKHPAPNVTGPICRWTYCGIIVDVMPTDESVLGFHNRWYESGLKNAEIFKLPDETTVQGFSLPYLMATKVEAFLDRGKNDFVGSRDMEDLFALLDGAPDVFGKVKGGDGDVINYLARSLGQFLKSPLFTESAEGHIPDPVRAEKALSLCRHLAAL